MAWSQEEVEVVEEGPQEGQSVAMLMPLRIEQSMLIVRE